MAHLVLTYYFDHVTCHLIVFLMFGKCLYFIEENTTAKLNFITIATSLVIWARLFKSAISANRGLNCLTDN